MAILRFQTPTSGPPTVQCTAGAALARGDLVRLTGARQVARATAAGGARGVVITPSKGGANTCTVAFFGSGIYTAQATGAISAGAAVRAADYDGSTPQVAAWNAGSDSPTLIIGYALTATTGVGPIEILTV